MRGKHVLASRTACAAPEWQSSEGLSPFALMKPDDEEDEFYDEEDPEEPEQTEKKKKGSKSGKGGSWDDIEFL